jgi:hypothetical protein
MTTMSKLADKIIAVAEKEIGVHEIDGSNCGVRVDEYKSATNLPPHESWPWCSAFVCWVVKQAMEGGTYTFKRPTTAGAWDLERWSKEQDSSTQTKRDPGSDIQPGDIVIYKFSHVGIAQSHPDPSGNFRAVEGNTDGAGGREGGTVLLKTRHISKVKTRIRFTV